MSANPPKLELDFRRPRLRGGWDQMPFIYHAAWSLNDYIARAIVTTNVTPDRYSEAFGTRRLLTLHNTLRSTLGLSRVVDPSSVVEMRGRKVRLEIGVGFFLPLVNFAPGSTAIEFGAVPIRSTVLDRVDVLKWLACRSPVGRQVSPSLMLSVAHYWFDSGVRGQLGAAVETLDEVLPPEGKYLMRKPGRQASAPSSPSIASPPSSAAAPRTRRGDRKGRPTTSDAAADARLVADWEAARNQGARKSEFCRDRGVGHRELDQAIDRNRKRLRSE